ncbi:phage replisome organizer N-terminal domain-containing protein [Streptococcus ruminantium]|uniref:phage replisome organizer N-terminal domain-containing protein n=1 Tax=Streptococcus ruminantium TaxID=1917441 RepID=UPI0013EF3E7E|nr:phage replisome organizer N-terminal domain-containing protein [Streptococcus ruminantium]
MAGREKTFYFLKLEKDFFDKKEIKLLRRIAGGDTYTIIYLKMLLMSLSDEGFFYFENIGNDIAEEVAVSIEEDIENVSVTLSYLQKKGLLEIVETDKYYLNSMPEMVGQVTSNALRQRRFQAKKKQQALENNATITQHNVEKEQELEKEQEKEQEKDIRSTYKMFEEEYGRLLSSSQSETVLKLLKENPAELVQEALKRSVLNGKTKRGTLNLAYIEGILRNWQLDNVQSVSDIRKPKPNYSNSQSKQSNIPDWSTEPVKTEQTKEGQARLAELYAELEAMENGET